MTMVGSCGKDMVQDRRDSAGAIKVPKQLNWVTQRERILVGLTQSGEPLKGTGSFLREV